jgi:hypothetical protein
MSEQTEKTEEEKKEARLKAKEKAKERAKLKKDKDKKEEEQQTTEDGSTKARFELKKWNGVTVWTIMDAESKCAICRSELNESCINCKSDGIYEDCVVV